MNNIIIFSILFSALFSCSNLSNDQKMKTAFKDLETRYAELEIPADSSYLNYYTLMFTTDNKYKGMKYKVYRRDLPTNAYSSDKESIYILTLEYKDKLSAIPIFPFSNAVYWNYENSDAKFKKAKYNFQFEYNRILKDLAICDSFRLVRFPYYIITNDILYLQNISFEDTLGFSKKCNYYGKDSLFITTRKQQNAAQLIRIIHPESDRYDLQSLRDINSEHFIWGSFEPNRTKKYKLIFKAFNFECEDYPMIYL